MHTLDPQLLERPISILVVGCGGNGSAIVSGLPTSTRPCWPLAILVAFR